MDVTRLLLLALALGLPALSQGQWRWVDGKGQTVFSDQPPPPEIPAAKILRQPGAKAKPAADEAAPAPAPPASRAAAPLRIAASAARPSGKDKELLEKKRQAEAAEEEKKRAQEEEHARLRADNCERARRSKASFDSGVRITRMNDKGEREVLDDAQRAAEVKRLEGLIARDCKAPGGT